MLHIPTHGTYDMCQRYCIMATPSLVYLFKRVKHGTQNIQNDCHQWLSGTFTVGTCESFFLFESNLESNQPSDSFSNRSAVYTTQAVTEPDGLQAYRTAAA